MTTETDLQIRLRRAKEAVSKAKAAREDAIRAQVMADSSYANAKRRYEELFLEEEKAEADRRKTAYLHCTA